MILNRIKTFISLRKTVYVCMFFVVMTFVLVACKPRPPVTNPPIEEAYDVITSADTGEGSLREAIMNANSNDLITISPNVVTISLNSEIHIDKILTLKGETDESGALTTTILSSNGRIFNITAGTFNLQDLILSTGYAEHQGGLIYAKGSVHIESSILKNGDALYGGAIYAKENVTFYNSILESNVAAYGGGIYSEASIITNASVIRSNDAHYGAALFAVESIVTTNTIIYDNTSQSGAILSVGMPGAGASDIILIHTTIVSNTGQIISINRAIQGEAYVYNSILVGNDGDVSNKALLGGDNVIDDDYAVLFGTNMPNTLTGYLSILESSSFYMTAVALLSTDLTALPEYVNQASIISFISIDIQGLVRSSTVNFGA